jgi:hypothetical protein
MARGDANEREAVVVIGNERIRGAAGSDRTGRVYCTARLVDADDDERDNE